jgi:hypothetical protein
METWPDDLDIESWRQAYRDLQSRGSASCPPDDRLITLVLHGHPCPEREQLADHIVNCRRCTGLYRILLHVHRDLTGKHPDTAPSESTMTSETVVQDSSEREGRDTQAPPQRSICP